MTESAKRKRKILNSCWNFEKYDDPQSITIWWAPIIYLIGIFLYGMILIRFRSLPTAMLKSDEAANPHSFIGERAYANLKYLTDLGPKIGGSNVSDIDVFTFLEDYIEQLSATADPSKEIVISTETYSTGALILDEDRVYSYHNLKNLVVMLRPAGEIPPHSLLINSHYDTVPTSPGAGDAGSMVVVMLEILRVLSKSTEHFKHSIIFLFNGSEEANLAGSHAFITQHSWRNTIRALINLDAAGNGGREIMFQAGPMHPWLMRYYKNSAPRPYSSAMGEELFQANLIPSDTDFRIFRDFGNIPGMDFAYSNNGYVYHTKYDSFDILPIGTLQHTGDNILALTKSLANAPEMENTEAHKDGKVVFYDFLGWFLIFYTEHEGVIINSIISSLALVTICLFLYFIVDKEDTFLKVLFEFGIIIIIQILSIAIGVGLTIALGYFHDGINYSMSWFAEPWLIFGLYMCPLIVGLTLGPMLYITFRNKSILTLEKKTQLFLNAHCLFFVILLLGLTISGYRSAFIIMISVFFYTCSTIINLILIYLTKKSILKKFKFQYWILIHFIGQLLPFLFYSYLSIISFSTFMPLSARNGPNSNPEFLITIFSVLMGLLLTGFIAPFIIMFRSPKLVFLISIIIYLVSLILLFTPVGFPYREATATQRHTVFHFDGQHYNGTEEQVSSSYKSAISMALYDRHTSYCIKNVLNEMNINNAIKANDFCEGDFLCELPFYINGAYGKFYLASLVDSEIIEVNDRVSIDNYFHPISLSIGETVDAISSGNFSLTGPTHMRIFISPMPGVRISEWSFTDVIPYNLYKGRYVYDINFYQGLTNESEYSFYIKLDGSSLVNIAVAGQYFSNFSPYFISFIEQFPNWAHITPATSFYRSYTFNL